MIFHLSINALDPAKVAAAIAEITHPEHPPAAAAR